MFVSGINHGISVHRQDSLHISKYNNSTDSLYTTLFNEVTSGLQTYTLYLMSFNPLKTKRRLLYLKTQSVPRCKHFSSRL